MGYTRFKKLNRMYSRRQMLIEILEEQRIAGKILQST
jgi:hypothetical protein